MPGWLDLDLDFPKEIPAETAEVVAVYGEEKTGLRGWLLHFRLPILAQINKGKKEPIEFFCQYPEIKSPEQPPLKGMLRLTGQKEIVVKLHSKKGKKKFLWGMNYVWDGKNFVPAPLLNL